MGLIYSFGRDLRFALRQMRQTPIVSGVALLSLALGIGANVAIFSLVNALILKSLPIHEPDRLAVMGRLDKLNPSGGASTSATHPQFEYLRDHQDFLSGVTAVSFARFNLNASGEARNVPGLYVDGRFLDTLGVIPAIGRGFTTEDDRRGGGPDGPVAIASHGFWQREHGGERSILGRTINLDGHPFTIIGVTPRDFHGVRVGFTFDVMIPLGSEVIIRGPESSLGRRTSWWLTIFARLAPGQTRAEAESRMAAFQPQLREATMPQSRRPEDDASYLTEPIVFESAAAGISSLRTRYSRPLFVLLGIVGLVLAIACANMANLLLAQSVARRRELAVRLSLGAGRAQLVRQLLVESVMLSLVGAASGLLFALWGVALSFVLVLGSTLFVRTLIGLTNQAMGFESDNVMLATIDLRRTGVAEGARLPIFERIRDEVAAIPGVEAAATSFVTPVSGSTWFLDVRVPGHTALRADQGSLFNGITRDYFKTLGTPMLAGRDFTATDDASRPLVMVVNEAFAKAFLPGTNPVGRTFMIESLRADRPELQVEVIGLVADAKYQSLREKAQPTMYGSLAQQDRISSSVRMVIRTTGAPWGARGAILNAVAGVNNDVVVDLKTLEEDLGANIQQERLIASLSAFFGGLALLLAALGLYGVMSYSVTRRKNEIGIRMALGAEPDKVVRLVLRHVALITVVGLIVGAAGAVATGRFINTLLFNLAATDKTMIAITAVTLAAAAAMAGYLPARRAARIDPMTALRDE